METFWISAELHIATGDFRKLLENLESFIKLLHTSESFTNIFLKLPAISIPIKISIANQFPSNLYQFFQELSKLSSAYSNGNQKK
jgi:hypothetical protein